MRNLEQANVSKYIRHTSFQNLFHRRLQQMPGKRERAQITINTVIEHTIGNKPSSLISRMGHLKWKSQN